MGIEKEAYDIEFQDEPQIRKFLGCILPVSRMARVYIK